MENSLGTRVETDTGEAAFPFGSGWWLELGDTVWLVRNGEILLLFRMHSQ